MITRHGRGRVWFPAFCALEGEAEAAARGLHANHVKTVLCDDATPLASATIPVLVTDDKDHEPLILQIPPFNEVTLRPKVKYTVKIYLLPDRASGERLISYFQVMMVIGAEVDGTLKPPLTSRGSVSAVGSHGSITSARGSIASEDPAEASFAADRESVGEECTGTPDSKPEPALVEPESEHLT